MHRRRCKFCGTFLKPEEKCRCQMTGEEKKNAYKRELASIQNKIISTTQTLYNARKDKSNE